jgi:hypothetical protein
MPELEIPAANFESPNNSYLQYDTSNQRTSFSEICNRFAVATTSVDRVTHLFEQLRRAFRLIIDEGIHSLAIRET